MTKGKKKLVKTADSRQTGARTSSDGSGSGKSKSRRSVKSRKSSPKTSKTKQMSSKKSIGINRRPTSLSSMVSQYNLAIQRYPKANTPVGETLQLIKSTAYLIKYGDRLYDAVMLFVVCPTHQKLALCGVNDCLFLPFGPIKSNQSWLATAGELIRKLLPAKEDAPKLSPPVTEPVLVDVLRLQLPTYFDFITRVTYSVELTSEACKAKYCADTESMGWYSLADLPVKVSKQPMIGPEPLMRDNFQPDTQFREVTVIDALFYTTKSDQSAKGELLRCTGASEDEILAIYGDFLQHVYPSEYMTLNSFKSYLKIVELKITQNIEALFRAFAFNKKRYLNFHEFIIGLAVVGNLSGTENEANSTASNAPSTAISPCSSSDVAKLKASFLFRYYAATDAASMNDDELDRAANECKIQKATLTKLKGLMKNGRLSMTSFISIVEQHIASNTAVKPSLSLIFEQFSVSPVNQLSIRPAYPAINRSQVTAHRDQAIKAKLAMRFLCENCRSKQYSLSVYWTKLSTEGQLYEPTETKQNDAKRMNKARRVRSERFFTKSFICNQLVDMLRNFAAKMKLCACKIKPDREDWSQPATRFTYAEKIIKVCKEATDLFAKGPRVIKINSPCYVIGDIHGNLRDLLLYEQSIWRVGFYFSTSSVLFLGDYVDRGENSVECILYLLCMKILAPDRVHMLRGNHETRQLQKEFTFEAEVNTKFGPTANSVLNAFNAVFDVMPLVAIVDESIYCAHGGIPSCASKVEQIAAIPCPLEDPDNDSNIAMEILWNDPITDREYADLLAHGKDMATSAANVPKGFLSNTKRGTGCYYSDQALEHFLAGNGLSHVIRAHECIPAGFQFHDGGRCVTVFSCSLYCGGINEAAVALVHDSQIRVIKVDTPSR